MPASPVPVVTGPPRARAETRCVVTVGVFDGVHVGHRRLIAEARKIANRRGIGVTVLTFDPHPMTVVRPTAAPQMLATLQHRVELLAGAGADEVRVATFDPPMSAMTAHDFVLTYLVQDCGADAVVAGENFRFGHRAAGDLDLLRLMGREHGFEVVAAQLFGDVSEAWSSTRIRQMIRDGEVAAAAEGLTRWHRVEGSVVRGDGRGRELGYPTANLSPPANTCRPGDGVYAGWLRTEPYEPPSHPMPAAISVGANTTFDGTQPRVEGYVLGRDDLDLYDRWVAVDFVQRIRDMRTFTSVSALTEAMARDVEQAGQILRG